MAGLKDLILVSAEKAQRVDRVHRQRNLLIGKYDEQLGLAKAQMAGESYSVKHFKVVTNRETGEKARVEALKRVRSWFWRTTKGTLQLQLRYGSKVIELAKGKDAIEVADLGALVNALTVIKSSVLAGELDVQLSVATGSLRTRFKGKQ